MTGTAQCVEHSAGREEDQRGRRRTIGVHAISVVLDGGRGLHGGCAKAARPVKSIHSPAQSAVIRLNRIIINQHVVECSRVCSLALRPFSVPLLCFVIVVAGLLAAAKTAGLSFVARCSALRSPSSHSICLIALHVINT